MYPNPKTRTGQILCQLLNAITVGTSVLYLVFLFIYPLAPETASNGGFLEFSPLLESFFLLILSLPLFVSVMAILLCARRFISLKTNESPNTKKHKFINISHIITFLSAILSLLLYLFYIMGKDSLFSFVLMFCTISCALLATVFVMQRTELKSQGATKTTKPVFEVNIYKKPIFIITVIILAIALLSIPTSHERVAFEDDPHDHLYDRTNSFTYSYIKIEDKNTQEKVDTKFVIFPFNYKETGELFGFR